MAKAPKLDPKLCTRCRGKGYRATPVVHYGVPGLCWDCDGDGTRETQNANKAKRKAEKIRREQYLAVTDMIWAVRNEHGGPKYPPTVRRRLAYEFPEDESFTTHQYADKAGIQPKEAWIELCRYTHVYPVLDEAGKPCGWTVSR